MASSWIFLLILLKLTVASRASAIVCFVDEFRCVNSQKCIDEKYVCDLENDCGDNSDERNCDKRVCKTDEFRCVNGQCIAWRWKCDGDLDCKDHSDESDDICDNDACNKLTTFNCTSTSGDCLPLSWRCDGSEDCDGGEDELNCQESDCSAGYFKCVELGDCIQNKWRCDGNLDCSDGSDEKNCTKQCKVGKFKCSIFHECVKEEWRCDGNYDCADRTDEANCPTEIDRNCPGENFACHSGLPRCISNRWHCDGDSDCEDHSDEAFCPDSIAKCNGTDFHCNNRRECVPVEQVCNGADDCEDGSDEENCNERGTSICDGTTHYTCLNSIKCIPAAQVCDNHEDCPHGDDEQKCDMDLCATSNCTHQCINTPGSFKCTCHNGYDLAEDKTTCQDINECEVNNPCDSVCVNTKGSYKCVCHKGYTLDPRTNACEEDDIYSHTQGLLVAFQHGIKQFNGIPRVFNESKILDSGDSMISAIFFDPETQTLYFMDTRGDRLLMYSMMKAGAPEVIVTGKDTSYPVGIAASGDLLYWVDEYFHSLSVVNVKSGHIKVIFEGNSTWTPLSIAIAPKKRYVFVGAYTNFKNQMPFGEICRWDMDGQNWKYIVRTSFSKLTALTYDSISDKLYWINSRSHQLQSYNVDGQRRTTLLESVQLTMPPTSMIVFQEQVYWSSGSALYSIQKTVRVGHKRNIRTLVGHHRSVDITGLAMNYKPTSLDKVTDFCANSTCELMCLPSHSVTNYTCVCPNGYLTNNDTSCTIVSTPTTTTTSTTASTSYLSTTQSSTKTTTTTTVSSTTTVATTTAKATTANVTANAIVVTTVSQLKTGSSKTVLIVVGITGLVGFVIFLLYFLYRRRNRMPKSVNFDNPVYRKTTVRFGQLNDNDNDIASSTSQDIDGSWDAGLVKNEQKTAQSSNHHIHIQSENHIRPGYQPLSDREDDDISITYSDKANLVNE